MEFYAYMVTCADQSIYTGHADNLEARLAAHNDGRFRGFTFTRRPVRLIFQTSFATRQEAIEAERQIKGWSREKKLARAEGDWELLVRLSLRRQPQKASESEETAPPFMVREPHHEREGVLLWIEGRARICVPDSARE